MYVRWFLCHQIDRFADELEVFKEDMESVLGVGWEEEEEEEGGRSVGGLGTLQDAVEVREETDEVGSGVWEAVNTVKVRGVSLLPGHCTVYLYIVVVLCVCRS